jgi:hypothetical protein
MEMRTWLCVWIIAGIAARSGSGLAITGQVVDSKARPVQGAEVAVYERYSVGRWDYDGKLIAPITKTDSQGRFQLQANVSSQYDTFIVARKSGLALAWDGLNYGLNKKARGVFLLVLEPPCVLTGQLVDPDGKPVVNTQVQALPITSYLERLRQRPMFAPQEWFTSTTDAQGRFRFEQFAADVSVTFRVKTPSSGTTHIFRTHEQDRCGFEVWRSDLRLTLSREGTIKGQVLNDQGQPVGGVDLLIGPERQLGRIESLYMVRKMKSEPDGTFVIGGIPEGSHQIDVLAPEQGPDLWVGKCVNVSLKPGQTVGETTIQVIKGGTVEVTVLLAQSKRPLAGAKVRPFGQEWVRSEAVLTDAKGVARLRVPAGSYTIEASSDGFSPWQSSEQVANGETLRYEALLTPERKFNGRVLDSTGQPAADVVVSIHPFGDHVCTDSRGRFDGGRNEQYGAQGGFVVARDTRNGLASAVVVTDWSRPVDLRLAPAWTLVGRVVDPNDIGIPAARVSLTLNAPGALSDLGVELLTDSQGRFEMKAIPPTQNGFDYRLSADAAGYGAKKYSRISVSGQPGTTVDIGAFQLPLADASVSGVVVDANGALARHVPIFVNGLPGVSQPSKATATNDKGEFAIRRLCKGPIRIQASFRTSPGGAGSIQTELPTQALKITLGTDIKTTAETSILGKPLPSLADLSPTLSQVQADGKPIVMCFIDVEQRPSRQCLSELSRKTPQDVSLFIVQSTRVEMKQYEGGLKQSGVTAPIHIASGDFAAKQSAWGVKSLPWLILTDKNHVVRAEGFALDELDRKIKELGNSRP